MNTEERHKYEYEVDTSSETAAANVVRMVGQNKRALELGCGPGSITKILAERGGCRVTGIELDRDAIERVKPYCEVVMQADLNSDQWPLLLTNSGKFDVVLAADVLEHLYDPWSALKRMVAFINESGCLVLSLPHVGHAAIMSCLYNGDFGYRDWGLLDRTHIRFFGLKNIEDLFAQAALKVIDVKYINARPEQTEFAESWARLSPQTQQVFASTPHANVYQVVVKAVPISYPGEPRPIALSAPAASLPPASMISRIGSLLSYETKRRIRNRMGAWGIRIH